MKFKYVRIVICQVFEHLPHSNTRELIIPQGLSAYRTLEEIPTACRVFLFFHKITEISESDKTMTATLTLYQTWQDPRLDINSKKATPKGRWGPIGRVPSQQTSVSFEPSADFDPVWTPDTIVSRLSSSTPLNGPFQEPQVHSKLLEIRADGNIRMSTKMTVKTTCERQVKESGPVRERLRCMVTRIV